MWIETELEPESANPRDMVSVQLHNGTGLVYEDTVSELHNHVIYNIEAGKYLLDIQVRDSCLENILSQTSGEVELETHTGFMGGLSRTRGVTGETAPPSRNGRWIVP